MKVKIDDNYASVGDHLNLIPMATCNRCYDQKFSRQSIEEKIQKNCYKLANDQKMKQESKNEIRAKLTILTRSYSRAIADQRNVDDKFWTQEFVENLMDNPDKCFVVMQAFRRLVPRTFAPREAAEPRTPHND